MRQRQIKNREEKTSENSKEKERNQGPVGETSSPNSGHWRAHSGERTERGKGEKEREVTERKVSMKAFR